MISEKSSLPLHLHPNPSKLSIGDNLYSTEGGGLWQGIPDKLGHVVELDLTPNSFYVKPTKTAQMSETTLCVITVQG